MISLISDSKRLSDEVQEWLRRSQPRLAHQSDASRLCALAASRALDMIKTASSPLRDAHRVSLIAPLPAASVSFMSGISDPVRSLWSVDEYPSDEYYRSAVVDWSVDSRLASHVFDAIEPEDKDDTEPHVDGFVGLSTAPSSDISHSRFARQTPHTAQSLNTFKGRSQRASVFFADDYNTTILIPARGADPIEDADVDLPAWAMGDGPCGFLPHAVLPKKSPSLSVETSRMVPPAAPIVVLPAQMQLDVVPVNLFARTGNVLDEKHKHTPMGDGPAPTLRDLLLSHPPVSDHHVPRHAPLRLDAVCSMSSTDDPLSIVVPANENENDDTFASRPLPTLVDSSPDVSPRFR